MALLSALTFFCFNDTNEISNMIQAYSLDFDPLAIVVHEFCTACPPPNVGLTFRMLT